MVECQNNLNTISGIGPESPADVDVLKVRHRRSIVIGTLSHEQGFNNQIAASTTTGPLALRTHHELRVLTHSTKHQSPLPPSTHLLDIRQNQKHVL